VRELEFLPEEYIRARFHRRVCFIRSWLLLVLGLVMALWSVEMGTWVHDARAELQALRGTGFAVGVDAERVERLQAEEQSYRRRLEAIEHLRPKASATGLVAALADLVPDGVVFEEVRLAGLGGADGDEVRLHVAGRAATEVLVTRMLGALEASPYFDGAILARSGPEEGKNGPQRSFAIEVNPKPAVEMEETKGALPPGDTQTAGR